MTTEYENLDRLIQTLENKVEQLLSKANVNEPHSFDDAISMIKRLDSSNDDDIEQLIDITRSVGREMKRWGRSFENAKLELLVAAVDTGFTYPYLTSDIEVFLTEGLTEFYRETEK